MDFDKFLHEYLWVPIVIAVLLVIIVIVLVCYFCKCCRQGTDYEYVRLVGGEDSINMGRRSQVRKAEVGIVQRMEMERTQKEKAAHTTAWFNAQYYLRANPHLSDLKQLEPLGSRPRKNWFRVFEARNQLHIIMTMVEKPDKFPVPFTVAWRKTVKDMLDLLLHPYIYPISDIDFMVDQGLIVVRYPLCKRGSLKDYIYQCSCTDSWRNKYKTKRKGLSITQVRGFGKQILMALIYMEDKGFPPHGHVHTGNIAIESNSCRIMGCESSLIGEEPKIYPLIRRKLKRNADAIDVICFGHVLYEMCVGTELDTAHPNPGHLNVCRNPDIVKILNFIFPESGQKYPTLKEISEHEFFANVSLSALDVFPFAPIHLSREMKNLVKAVKKGVPILSRRKSKLERSMSTASDLNARTDPSTSTAPPSPVAPPPPPDNAPPPPPPGNAPPPPPPSMAPPPPSFGAGPDTGAPTPTKNRSALLGDIRKGMSLKKTETNDRSAPKL